MTDQRTTTDWLMEAMIATEDGFAVYDATGRLVFCNDSFRRINGYTETTAYPGVTYDDLGKVDSQISAPTRPQFTFHQRVASIRENGPIVIEQVYGGRIYARHQSVTPSGGLVSVISDVTALKSAQAEAERANHAKSEFLATMSHEIRTPMAGVMGFADMLLDDPLPGESRDKVLSIKDASRALLAILNDILDVSKLEAGRMEVEDEDFLLAPLLDGVMTLIGETIRDREAKTLDLRCVVADECPPALRGDAARIRQILVNLLGNAVKFTPEGTVTLKVERECDAEGAEWLRFGVRDTGIGIAPEHIEGLFDDFTQADASISRRFEGTGLGLAICRRLVTLMQGEIGVESELGVGSMFWFTLPMAAATTPVSELAGAAEEWEFAVAASRPLRVLVAEDNPAQPADRGGDLGGVRLQRRVRRQWRGGRARRSGRKFRSGIDGCPHAGDVGAGRDQDHTRIGHARRRDAHRRVDRGRDTRSDASLHRGRHERRGREADRSCRTGACDQRRHGRQGLHLYARRET
jgi:signal transduction histidine kinase